MTTTYTRPVTRPRGAFILCQACTTFWGNAAQDACKAAWPWASSSGSRCVILYGPCNIFKPLCLFLLQPFVLSAQTKHAGRQRNGRVMGSHHSSLTCTSILFPSSSFSLLLKLSPRSTAQRPVPRTSSNPYPYPGLPYE